MFPAERERESVYVEGGGSFGVGLAATGISNYLDCLNDQKTKFNVILRGKFLKIYSLASVS